MGSMSRRKGAAGEREAAAKLNEVMGTRFHRGRQYHGGPESPDLAGDLPGLHVEVKRCERLNLYPALAQARRDASGERRRLLVIAVEDLIRLLDVVNACWARLESGLAGRGAGSGGRSKGSGEGPRRGSQEAGNGGQAVSMNRRPILGDVPGQRGKLASGRGPVGRRPGE
jgi:hypothetical protein